MNILFYPALAEFKNQFYKQLITIEHLISDEIRLDKVTYSDGEVEESVNIWGYKFKKDGVKYILQSNKPDGTFLKLKEVLPIMAVNTQKVAYMGVSYDLISKPVSAKFQALKKMSFKSMVNKFTSLKHTNPTHQKLMWFIGLSHLIDRSNSRICSPPSNGKDSVIEILGNLVGDCASVVGPTLAKLEYMTNFKWIAINEAVDVPKGEWRPVEQFLLDVGAFKPEVTKHSRAVTGTKETLDISSLSVCLLYNDITNYNRKTPFFDEVAKDAVKDRFPPFRFYGYFIEDFNQSNHVDLKEFVKSNMQEYKDLLYTITFYKENLFSELHHYKTTIFDDMRLPSRWYYNINSIMKIIDLYSDSFEEFEMWCRELQKCLLDYKNMLKYPKLLEEKVKLVGSKKGVELVSELDKFLTFTDKIRYLKGFDNVKRVEDKNVFW
jgi:hypothetical protein